MTTIQAINSAHNKAIGKADFRELTKLRQFTMRVRLECGPSHWRTNVGVTHWSG